MPEGGWGRLMLVAALACGASVVTPLRFSCSVFCTADAPRWRVAIVGPRGLMLLGMFLERYWHGGGWRDHHCE